MSADLSATLHALPRIGRVFRILERHGLLRAFRGERHWPTPTNVREALEELGVVALKFGQALALRTDLLPPAYVEELGRLHDRLPPMPFDIVRETVEQALGGSLVTLYATFETEPLAAATIAQVHAATLTDGRHVVVKVRRPGLQSRIDEDCGALTYLAALAERFNARLRALDVVGMVREFRESLTRETDLRREGETIRRFRVALADAKDVWIPDVVLERTAEAVLTLEHSPGQRLEPYGAAHPETRSLLARRIAAVVMHQVLDTGLFHADPHPGNVFVLPDGRICLHDFGMIGELNVQMREGLIAVLEAIVSGDARALTDAYFDLGVIGPGTDRPRLEADLSALLQRVRERPLAEVSVGDAIQSILRAGGQHHLRNPGVLLLLARAIFLAESLMRRLDPELNVVNVFRDQVERVALGRFAPGRLIADGKQLARDVERALRETPADLRRTLRRTADGELGRVQAPELEAVGRRASRDIERLTGAVASAALIISGALLATIEGWHRVAGDLLIVIGAIGTTAVALGAFTTRRH